jgi:hypothetical protein
MPISQAKARQLLDRGDSCAIAAIGLHGAAARVGFIEALMCYACIPSEIVGVCIAGRESFEGEFRTDNGDETWRTID